MHDTYVLAERPLTDDTLAIAAEGWHFRGGYVAILTYHTFASPWADTEHVRRFRSMDRCEEFVRRHYGKPWEALVYGDDD